MIVFLGGTCGESTWRKSLIPCLDFLDIKYFNPVVEDWNEAAQVNENAIKADKDTFHLFVITKEMRGVFSIAEAVDASNKYPKRTLFHFIEDGFDKAQLKSLFAVGKLILNNGAMWTTRFDLIPENIIGMTQNMNQS